MGASCEDLSCLSVENFPLCVQSLTFAIFYFLTLQVSQFQVLFSFICGDEVFRFLSIFRPDIKVTDISNSATRTHVDF